MAERKPTVIPGAKQGYVRNLLPISYSQYFTEQNAFKKTACRHIWTKILRLRATRVVSEITNI